MDRMLLKRKREELAWTPYARQRGGVSPADAAFQARTTVLFRELQSEMAAKILEARRQLQAEREESRRLAEKHPLPFLPVVEASSREQRSASLEVTPPMNPSSPVSGVEPMVAVDRKKVSAARETPSMGPSKAGSILDAPTPPTSAFSRYLSFVVGDDSHAQQQKPDFLPPLVV